MTTPCAGMGGVIRGGAIAIAIALGAATSAVAQTEPISFLRTPGPIVLSVSPSELLSAPHRTIGFTFNTYGDLEVRYRDVTMTMAYNPLEDLQRSQDRIRIVQRRDIRAISGISIRVSMAFW